MTTKSMPPPIARISDWQSKSFSMIIDVRSNSEYVQDHIPGAISMPVLNDAERALIGTMYKLKGPFEAKRRGAALVTRNISSHLESKLYAAPKDFAPLIYCWRGGQRSEAMARVLSEVGWKVTIIEGGYKTYRKQVLEGLKHIPTTLSLIIIRGRTGTAKTRILRAARDSGAQIIDLEALAAHRGSLLGTEPGMEQPSQRMFESKLFNVLRQLDLTRPVFVEAESNKIGTRYVPVGLWRAMQRARALHLVAPMPARVAFLLDDYKHIVESPERLEPLLNWVTKRIGSATVERWRQAIQAHDWTGFVSRALIDHYDPAYDRSAAKQAYSDICTLDINKINNKSILETAKVVVNIK